MKKNYRKILIIFVLSFFLTAMQITGLKISVKYCTSVHTLDIFSKWCSLPSGWLLLTLILEFLFISLCLTGLFSLAGKFSLRETRIKKMPDKKIWPCIGAVLFLLWIPAFLAVYPGLFSYDITGQLPQAMYDEVPYNTHHSLLHTLICGKIITFGYGKTGNLSVGIALYSIFQMIFCASFFTCFVYRIYKTTRLKCIAVLSFIYYALSPVIVMYALSTTKDVLCCTLLLFAVMELFELFRQPDTYLHDHKKTAVLSASLIFMCLFRKNGIIALLIYLVFLICFLREHRKKTILLFVAIISVYFITSNGLILALSAEKGESVEAFCVPVQQIARVVSQRGSEAFSENDWDALEKVADLETWDEYNPILADNVKNHINFDHVEENPMVYLKIWAKYLIKYPDIYILSFLENTYQAWYPSTLITEAPYASETYYFNMNMRLGVERETKLPALLDFYEKLASEFWIQKVPVVRLLFSNGFMLLTALVTLFYGLWSKKQEIIWPLLLVMAFCITGLLGPIMLIRYFLILFYGFPVFISWLFD